MKRQMLLLLLAVVSLGIARAEDAIPEEKPAPEAAVQKADGTQTADKAKAPQERPERPRAPRPAPRPERFITPESSIQKAEQSIKEILKRYDRNGNGRLDAGEKKIFLQEMEEAGQIYRLSQNYKHNLKIIDADGDLKISEEERALAEKRLKEARNNAILPHRPQDPAFRGRPPKFRRNPSKVPVPPAPPKPRPRVEEQKPETQPDKAPAEK